MNRYLINLSYLGTPFRGLQKQISANTPFDNDPSTIQGQIEIGLKKLRPLNSINLITSSRTDAGVHALHTTMHVDLERPNGKPYEPQQVTYQLNRYFTKLSIPIRILRTCIVPSDFNCRRHAISRTYIYKIATIQVPSENLPLWNYIPITQLNRCQFINADKFNVDLVKEAAKYFVGLHDFRTFMHKASSYPDKVTRRTIYEFDLNEVQSTCMDYKSWCNNCDPSNYKFYDFRIKGTGFLYKQVRRTVSSLLAVAQGTLTPKDIKFMLEIPSHHSWNSHILTVPAHGLYLAEVAYAQHHLDAFVDAIDEPQPHSLG